jgi:hypothetical protein
MKYETGGEYEHGAIGIITMTIEEDITVLNILATLEKVVGIQEQGSCSIESVVSKFFKNYDFGYVTRANTGEVELEVVKK